MKRLLTLLSFLFIWSHTYAQTYYQVTTESLNVRNSADKNAKILEKRYLGDSIYVVQYGERWSKVKVNDNEIGYVATKYISNEFKSESDLSALIYFLIPAILLYIIYRRYRKRCKKCEKWAAMKRTDSEVVEKLKSHIKKTLKRTHNGKTTSTREIVVPATKTKYLITETCKNCGFYIRFYEYETTEN